MATTSLPKPSIFRSLAIQGRVIRALLLREVITRYGRHNVGFLWLFFEPMLFTLGVTALWTLLAMQHGKGISVAAFAFTGYSSVLIWRNCVNRCNLSIQPNLALMYHRNVRVLDIFLARIVLEVAGATVSLVGLAAFFIFIGLAPLPVDPLEMCFGWMILIWYAVGLGTLIGALSERSEIVDRVWHIFTYLLFGLSGATFFVDWLPTKLQEMVLWLPMVNGVEILREGYFGMAFKFHYDLAYVCSFNLVLTLFGLALARETGRRVQPE